MGTVGEAEKGLVWEIIPALGQIDLETVFSHFFSNVICQQNSEDPVK